MFNRWCFICLLLLSMITLNTCVSHPVLNELKVISSNKVFYDSVHDFKLGDNDFLLDGKPLQMISGEMHYPRIPREAWRDRIKMAKAMGLNTIGTYVFWNIHEPQKGNYDFKGNNDVAEFIRLCKEEDMWVVLRPSPYVCAEWEYGGYPYWLQNEKDLQIRSKDPKYLEIYQSYINEIGKQLSPYLVNKGGNILMVQIENEYGSYGSDKEYLEINREMFIKAGFDGILFTCDPKNDVSKGYLPGLLPAINGEENTEECKDLVRKYHEGKGPFYVAEWYPAWFDSWSLPHHTVNSKEKAAVLYNILKAGISINMYMFHGGSDRGFMNGANYYEDQNPKYAPQTSSYDYDAPLDEAGNPTEKFLNFRDVIKEFRSDIPPVPLPKKTMKIENITFTSKLCLFEIIKSIEKVSSDVPLTFEQLNQAYGYVLYRTTVKNFNGGELKLTELRDFAVVMVNQERVGVLNRMYEQNTLSLKGQGTDIILDILVENLGRINFGSELLHNLKGLTSSVVLNGVVLTNWDMYSLPMGDLDVQHIVKFGLNSQVEQPEVTNPSFLAGSFETNFTDDTYLDLTNWGKGAVWINGKSLGRYWHIGPQQTIYVPREWIRKGKNELVVFEMLENEHKELKGVEKPILNVLQKDKYKQ